MSKLSPNFDRNELACPCCGVLVYDKALLAILEATRAHFKRTVRITSAYRCVKHNKAVGGAEMSMHRTGQAADIIVSGVAPAVVHAWLDATFGFLIGLGNSPKFTHVDIGSTSLGRRWSY